MARDYPRKANALLLSYLNKLDKQERTEFILLSKNWNTVLETLATAISELSLLEGPLTRDQLYRLGAYKEFLAESKKQIALYSNETVAIVKEYQLAFGKMGLEATGEILSLVTPNFNRLPVQTINNFIGLSQDGSPLNVLLAKSYPESVVKITDTLLRSIALGRGPRETARLMKDDMNGNLSRALRIARTEQMFVFRETGRQQMIESGVVAKWEWFPEPDACPFCLGQGGKQFDLNTQMETHPNCRCGQIPILKDVP